MMWPGTCPGCGGVGLLGVLAKEGDYLTCDACNWRSDQTTDELTETETVDAADVSAISKETVNS